MNKSPEQNMKFIRLPLSLVFLIGVFLCGVIVPGSAFAGFKDTILPAGDARPGAPDNSFSRLAARLDTDSGDQSREKNAVGKITVTFHGDTATSKGFTWYTGLASTGSDLEVVEKSGPTPEFNKAVKFSGRHSISTNSPGEIVHKAEASGLKSNTVYFFRVGDAGLNIWSEAGTFKTAPESGAFTFIDLADPQSGTDQEAALAARTIAKSLSTVGDAGFIAVNGDLVDAGAIEKQWDWLFGHARESFLNTTVLPVAGNHDADENSFIEHFDIMPAGNSDTTTGAYYSLDYSNAHFVILNNNEDSSRYANFTPAQIQWLREDVRAAKAAGAKWVIVAMHKGPYTTSGHATDADIMGRNGVRTLVAPIMEELGIDLVLQGHDHIYARSKAIKNGAAATAARITETLNGKTIEYAVNPDGTIYLIPGTAGPKVYYRNRGINKSYFNLFEVADENHAAVYGPDPADASGPLRGQIQNFVGITIDGDKLTAVSYEIDQNKYGARPYIIDQFGISKETAAFSLLKDIGQFIYFAGKTA